MKVPHALVAMEIMGTSGADLATPRSSQRLRKWYRGGNVNNMQEVEYQGVGDSENQHEARLQEESDPQGTNNTLESGKVSHARRQDGFGGTVIQKGFMREANSQKSIIQNMLRKAWYDKDFNRKMSCLCALNECIIELTPQYDEAVAKFATIYEARQLIIEAQNSGVSGWPTMLEFMTQIQKLSGINVRGTEWTDNTGRVAYDPDKLWPKVLDIMTEQQTELSFKQYYIHELQHLRCKDGEPVDKHFETFTSHMLKGGINDEDLQPSAERACDLVATLLASPPSAAAGRGR